MDDDLDFSNDQFLRQLQQLKSDIDGQLDECRKNLQSTVDQISWIENKREVEKVTIEKEFEKIQFEIQYILDKRKKQVLAQLDAEIDSKRKSLLARAKSYQTKIVEAAELQPNLASLESYEKTIFSNLMTKPNNIAKEKGYSHSQSPLPSPNTLLSDASPVQPNFQSVSQPVLPSATSPNPSNAFKTSKSPKIPNNSLSPASAGSNSNNNAANAPNAANAWNSQFSALASKWSYLRDSTVNLLGSQSLQTPVSNGSKSSPSLTAARNHNSTSPSPLPPPRVPTRSQNNKISPSPAGPMGPLGTLGPLGPLGSLGPLGTPAANGLNGVASGTGASPVPRANPLPSPAMPNYNGSKRVSSSPGASGSTASVGSDGSGLGSNEMDEKRDLKDLKDLRDGSVGSDEWSKLRKKRFLNEVRQFLINKPSAAFNPSVQFSFNRRKFIKDMETRIDRFGYIATSTGSSIEDFTNSVHSGMSWLQSKTMPIIKVGSYLKDTFGRGEKFEELQEIAPPLLIVYLGIEKSLSESFVECFLALTNNSDCGFEIPSGVVIPIIDFNDTKLVEKWLNPQTIGASNITTANKNKDLKRKKKSKNSKSKGDRLNVDGMEKSGFDEVNLDSGGASPASATSPRSPRSPGSGGNSTSNSEVEENEEDDRDYAYEPLDVHEEVADFRPVLRVVLLLYNPEAHHSDDIDNKMHLWHSKYNLRSISCVELKRVTNEQPVVHDCPKWYVGSIFYDEEGIVEGQETIFDSVAQSIFSSKSDDADKFDEDDAFDEDNPLLNGMDSFKKNKSKNKNDIPPIFNM